MDETTLLTDPLKFKALCWPDIRFYDKQIEVIQSVVDNDSTIVPAGNQLGKDFIAAFIAVWFFCSRSPCRVVTTSADHPQLKGVLWGEINRFIETSKYPLPLHVNDMHIRQVREDGTFCPLSYIIGRVTKKGEGLLGHHVAKTADGLPRTFLMGDEASALEDEAMEKGDTWAHRKLLIGNTYECQNQFRRGVKEGDIPRENGEGYHQKVIPITADMSPNVILAKNEIALGLEPSNEIRVPGVIDYPTYMKHRRLWNEIRQCVCLDAKFYEGAEILLYPPHWLAMAEERARQLQGTHRAAKAIGCDPAEGGDETSWSIIDDNGLIKEIAFKTPDTTEITSRTIALIHEYNVPPDKVLFDSGGGGYQIVCDLRSKGYNVKSVAFNESVKAPIKYGLTPVPERQEIAEERYVYKNLRAKMYGGLHNDMDPTINDHIFAIPAEYTELHRQLSPMPLLFDQGVMYMMPKDRKPGSKEITLKQILGCSPDRADSLVLARHALKGKDTRFKVTAA